MTLEESIRFHTEEAEKMKLHKKVNEIILGTDTYKRELQEHTQTAEWLKELAERRKLPEIIYCKDCRWWDKFNEKYGYCLAAKHGHWSENWEISIRRVYNEDFYCADAERITDDKTNKGSSR